MEGAVHGLHPPELTAVVGLLRTVARGEQVAEQCRVRLCEEAFDPWLAFKCLQLSPQEAEARKPVKGWVTVDDLYEWLQVQPHSIPWLKREDIESLLAPYSTYSSEMHYQGFLQLVLPRSGEHGRLQDLAMLHDNSLAPGPPWPTMPTEVAHRLCELFVNEIDVARHLAHHRHRLRELALSPSIISAFFSRGTQVPGLYGDAAPPRFVAGHVLRGFLVECLGALDNYQYDALARRINRTGSLYTPFEELLSLFQASLLPERPSLASRSMARSPSPTRSVPLSESRLREQELLQEPLSPRLSADSPLRSAPLFPSSPRVDMSPPLVAPELRGPVSPSRFSGCRSRLLEPTPPRAPRATAFETKLNRIWDRYTGAKQATRSACTPDRWQPDRSILASADASTADIMSPNRSSSFMSPSCSGFSRSPSRSPSPFKAPSYASPPRASSVPGAPRPRHTPTHMTPCAGGFGFTPSMDCTRRDSTRAVLTLLARIGELDARVEDAKSLLSPSMDLQAVFNLLDRFGKGYVADTDFWQFSQDFGASVTFSSLVCLVHEVQLRRARLRSCVPGRLTLRELGALMYPAHTNEFQELLECDMDSEALSVIYLLRRSEPCPGCGLRAQRDADAAGCPSVSCPRCGALFRCYTVVSDRAPHVEPRPPPPTGMFHLFKLVETAAKAAEELDRARKQLTLLPNYDVLGTLREAFCRLSRGRFVADVVDLRRELRQEDVYFAERELDLLWLRFSTNRSNGREVHFSEFARQLVPRHMVSQLL